MIQINWRPSNRDLRVFAGLQVVFFALLTFLWLRRTGHWEWGAVIMTASAAVGILGAVVPQRIRLIYLGWMLAVYPIGWTISHGVLGLVFLGLVTPLGLLLRWCGYDPLQLRRRQVTSYWQPRSGRRDARSYFRQF